MCYFCASFSVLKLLFCCLLLSCIDYVCMHKCVRGQDINFVVTVFYGFTMNMFMNSAKIIVVLELKLTLCKTVTVKLYVNNKM